MENTVYTDPSEPALNDGYDNCNGELIVSKNQRISDPFSGDYHVIDILGQGQFGQVYHVAYINKDNGNRSDGCSYALKITRSQDHFRKQAEHEINIHQQLQRNAKKDEMKYIVNMIKWFNYHGHVCIVTEYLSLNLYEVLQERKFYGLPLHLVKCVMKQLLYNLTVLEKYGIVHSDIKPENILLVDSVSTNIKLIDFGSSRTIDQAASQYIQSRYYRAPEVVLGYDHDFKIDIWSVACVAAELFVTQPLFAGQNESHLLHLISKMIGRIPIEMAISSPKRSMLFQHNLELKPERNYCFENSIEYTEFPHYFQYDSLEDIIIHYGFEAPVSKEKYEKEKEKRLVFVDLLRKMLEISPDQRFSASMCLSHPFFS